MTLRARALVALALVVVAFLVLGSVVLGTVRDATETGRRATQVLYPAGEQIAEILLANTDMERGVWGYAISGDPAFLTSYVAGRQQALRAYVELRALLAEGSPDQLPVLDRAEEGWQNWVDEIASPLIGQVQRGDDQAAREAITSGGGRRAFNSVRADLTLLDQALDARTAESVEQLAAINRRLSAAIIATAFATVVITAGATVATVRWVILPLEGLGRQMRRIARENDTTTPLRPLGPPEIAALGRDSEMLRQHLVSEIDIASEATEGLAQEGPAVAALSGLLRGPKGQRITGYGFGVASLAAEGALTGDWWDVITLTDAEGRRRTGIELCDIAGHDAAAGVVAARFKAALHVGLRTGASLAEAVGQASAIFTKTPDRFASYVAVEVDGDSLTYLNAGHNPPLLVRHGRAAQTLTGTGPLVTAMPAGRWHSARTTVASGDLIVIYTDGLVEARDERGEEVSEELLVDWCRALSGECAAADAQERAGYVARGLLDRARQRTADLRRDDVTVLVAVRD